LPPLCRFIPIGSCYRPFRDRLVSVLPRLRPGLGLVCRRSRLFSGIAKLRGTGVHVPFQLVEVRLPVGGRLIPGLSQPVPLISDLISPVSNEIALVSGPRALLFGRPSGHQTTFHRAVNPAVHDTPYGPPTRLDD